MAAHPCGTSGPRGIAGSCALEDKVEKSVKVEAKEAASTAAAVCPCGLCRTSAPCASGKYGESKEAGSAAVAVRPPCASRPCGKAKKGGSTATTVRPHESVRTHDVSGQYAHEHKAGAAGVAGLEEAGDKAEGGVEGGAVDGV